MCKLTAIVEYQVRLDQLKAMTTRQKIMIQKS